MPRADSDDDLDRGIRRDKFMNERARTDFGDRRVGRDDYGSPQQQYRRPAREATAPARARRTDFPQAHPPDLMSLTPRDESGGGGGNSDSVVPSRTFGLSSMMTFKQFLATQDDSISDEVAVQKYQEYKTEFRRQQLHSFFVAHKEEEWFRLKYHPDDGKKRKEETRAAVQRRLEVFQRLDELGWVNRAKLHADNLKNVIKVLDGVVILLENGGSDELEILDEMEEEEDGSGSTSGATNGRTSIGGDRESQSDIKSESGDKKSDNESSDEETGPAKKRVKKEEGAWSESDGEEKDAPPKQKERKKSPTNLEAGEVPSDKNKIKRFTKLHRTSSIFLRNLHPSTTRTEIQELCQRYEGFLRVALAEPLPERKFYRRGWVTFTRETNVKDICWNLNSIRVHDSEMGAIINRDLTRKVRLANSIHGHKPVAQNDLRLAVKLIQAYDAKQNLYQEDVQQEQQLELSEGVKIKDEDTEKEQQPPVPTPQIVVRNDGATSQNPLIQNIADYLIEEASAEEEELLGSGGGSDDDVQRTRFEHDESVMKVLDRMIVYLRLVHSVDFYNHGEYPNEDEMPNRCGLVHIRGPSSAFGKEQEDMNGEMAIMVPSQFVQDHMKKFEMKLEPMMKVSDLISDSEADQMGKKDAEHEVQAFINANCQELAKDKWLCPLSGKKFKGPEFVKKHIYSKHLDKIEEVKQEVEYFNNYLYDSKRPANQEQPTVQQNQPLLSNMNRNVASGGSTGQINRQGTGGYNRNQDNYGESGSGGGNYGRNRGNDYNNDEYGSSGGGGGNNYQRRNNNYQNNDNYQNRGYQANRTQSGSGGYNRGGDSSYGGGSSSGTGYNQRRDYNQGPRYNQQHYQRGVSSGGDNYRGGGRRDPREIRQYHDLDAPSDDPF